MSLQYILILTWLAFLASWLIPGKWKVSFFLISSLLSIYWLQPALTIRYLDFWLSTIAITLTVFTWIVTQHAASLSIKTILPASGFVILTILVVASLRYTGSFCCLTASRPPTIFPIIIFLAISILTAGLISYLSTRKAFLRYILIFAIISLLIIQKSAPLSEYSSGLMRHLTGQDVKLASALDISWLGFSYLAFRLLHVLQDANAGRLGNVSFGDFLVYALFFPSYTAGPIDRLQRFTGDLQTVIKDTEAKFIKRLSTFIQSNNFHAGLIRILAGIFKKFVLADSLSIIAINDQNALQLQEGYWGWILIYAYSLRIYLDFSGYTDIAIGIGNLMGFKLPENFSKPYQKTNLTTFWNSWHITLSQWFRAYFFNPVTRWLRAHPNQFPVWMIILVGQTGTMLLIGLWHGISWNFAIWGLWHAFGLFVHNRWLEWSRAFQLKMPQTRPMNIFLKTMSWFITFNYVSLGWVWFALSDPTKSLLLFQKIF